MASTPKNVPFVFSNVSPVSTDVFTATFAVTPQLYNGGSSQYNGTDIAVNMWVLDSLNGNTFKITNISSQTSSSVNVTIEDIDGFNRLSSTSANGGKPVNNQIGYVFELNQQGIPVLINIPNISNSKVFSSVLSRFISIQQALQGATGPTGPSGPQGATGATGPIGGLDTQVIYNNTGSAEGSSNLTFNYTTGLLSVSGLLISNILTTSDLILTNNRIHIGQSSGITNQNSNTVAIGRHAGFSNQETGSVAIGLSSGFSNQGNYSVAIGTNCGVSGQIGFGVALGFNAGAINQGASSVAIGQSVGNFRQAGDSIAIGTQAAQSNQQLYGIALGRQAANVSQGQDSIAIGRSAGSNQQGQYAIAIGAVAGSLNQISNSIILNATGSSLQAQTISGFYVAPVSESSNLSGLEMLTYNPVTSQIQQNSNVTISGGNVGINNLNPTHNLDVCGNQFVLRITNSNYGGIHFNSAQSGASNTGGYFIGRGGENSNKNQLVIHSSSGVADSGVNFITDNAVSRLYISSSLGYVGIATQNPSQTLTVVGNAWLSSSTTWNTGSDQRIKQNIQDASLSICYSNIKDMPLRRFTWDPSYREHAKITDCNVLGVVAQELQSVMPKSVTLWGDYTYEDTVIPDFLTVNIDQLNMAHIGATKQLIQEHESIGNRLTLIETENQQLKLQLSNILERLTAIETLSS